MSRDIEKKGKHEIVRRPASHDVEIHDPIQNKSPFISFRYSYKEISSGGGKTHVRSKKKSFENGQFKSEEFEGTLDGNVYSNMVGGMQKHFFNQMALLMKPFSMFLPGGSRDKEK